LPFDLSGSDIAAAIGDKIARFESSSAIDFTIAGSTKGLAISPAVQMIVHGPSRHFAATQHFGRFQTEADIKPDLSALLRRIGILVDPTDVWRFPASGGRSLVLCRQHREVAGSTTRGTIGCLTRPRHGEPRAKLSTRNISANKLLPIGCSLAFS
jgi:hypothetical protein